MPHTLIVGITGSGKTHMARTIASKIEKRRRVIFDPMHSMEIPHEPFGDKPTVVTADEQKFVEILYMPEMHDTDFFVDEADIIFPHHNKHKWLLQRGRHFGMRFFLVSQRPPMIDKTCRAQCERAFVFRSNKDDYKAVLPNYGIAEHANNLNIPMRHYLLLYPTDDVAKLMTIHPPI